MAGEPNGVEPDFSEEDLLRERMDRAACGAKTLLRKMTPGAFFSCWRPPRYTASRAVVMSR